MAAMSPAVFGFIRASGCAFTSVYAQNSALRCLSNIPYGAISVFPGIRAALGRTAQDWPPETPPSPSAVGRDATENRARTATVRSPQDAPARQQPNARARAKSTSSPAEVAAASADSARANPVKEVPYKIKLLMESSTPRSIRARTSRSSALTQASKAEASSVRLKAVMASWASAKRKKRTSSGVEIAQATHAPA